MSILSTLSTFALFYFFALNSGHNDNRFTYDHDSVEYCSGMFLYPPGGYCGWHTNSDTPGERIYISWCKDAKKSFFRYIDSFTGEMVTKYESQGWNVNRFQIPGDALLWHCVYSDTVRFSIGFHTVTGIHACTLSKAGDWRVDGRDRFLHLQSISHLLTSDTLEILCVSEIDWKGKDLEDDEVGVKCYCCGGERFKNVNLEFPPIVVRDAPNPSDRKYRLIDGKHRMMKMKELGMSHAKFYVLDYKLICGLF